MYYPFSVWKNDEGPLLYSSWTVYAQDTLNSKSHPNISTNTLTKEKSQLTLREVKSQGKEFRAVALKCLISNVSKLLLLVEMAQRLGDGSVGKESVV